MAERLTWDQIQGANFSGSNEAARMATSLLGSASVPLIAGVDDYQKAVAAQQSAELMKRVNAQQDPAAVAAGLTSGDIYKGLDPRYISQASQEFAAGQAQRLLNQSQTTAETGRIGAATNLLGVQTDQGRYDLNRQSQVIDPRADAKYAAEQALEPVQAEVTRLANSGDIAGAQAYARQNQEKYQAADVSMSAVLSGISSQVVAGQTDFKTMDQFSEDLRTLGQRNDARSILTSGTTHFKTLPEFTVGVENAVRSGLISPEAGQQAIATAGTTGVFNNSSPDAATDNKYGTKLAPPADNTWLNGGRDAFNAAMTDSESSGRRTVVNNDNPDNPAGGPLQFTQARVDDAIAAGILPKGMTVKEFAAMGNTPEGAALQDRAGAWHWSQIDQQAKAAGLEQYYGQTIQGVPINRDSIRAMAQIGGFQGMMDFLKTGKNPSDGNNSIRDYGLKFAGVDPMAPARGLNDPALGFGAAVPPKAPEQFVGPDPAAQLAQAAQAAAQKATVGISPLVPTQAPATVAQGPAAAAAASAAMSQTVNPSVPLPAPVDGGQTPLMQQMLDTNISRAANAPATPEQVQMATAPADVPVGTRTSNPRETLLDNQAAQAQTFENQRNARAAEQAMTPYGLSVPPPPKVADNPKQSGLSQTVWGNDLQQYVSTNTEAVANAINQGKVNGFEGSPAAQDVGGAYDYLFGSKAEALGNKSGRVAAQTAQEWWRSDAAKQYFEQNPNELQAASKDPIAFAQTKVAAAQEAALTESAKTSAEKSKAGQPFTMEETKGPVNPDVLKDEVGKVQDQFTADSSFTTMGNVLDSYSKLPSNGSPEVVAAALVSAGSAGTAPGADGSGGTPPVEAGALAGKDQQTVANRLIEIMDKTGIQNPAIAAAFLVNTQIQDYKPGVLNYVGSFDWWDDPVRIDIDAIKEKIKIFSGGEEKPTVQQLTSRLQEARNVKDATTKLSTVDQEFQQATKELQDYISRPGTTPQQDAEARRQYEQMVFPQIREKLRAVHATGLSLINSNRATGK